MPLYQTPVIPMNGGIDVRPIEFRPINTVDDIVNAIVKPEGTYRRPPLLHKTIINNFGANLENTIVEAGGVYTVKTKEYFLYVRLYDTGSNTADIQWYSYCLTDNTSNDGIINVGIPIDEIQGTTMELLQLTDDDFLVKLRGYQTQFGIDPNSNISYVTNSYGFEELRDTRYIYSQMLIIGENFNDGDTFTCVIYGYEYTNIGTVTISYDATNGYDVTCTPVALLDDGTPILDSFQYHTMVQPNKVEILLYGATLKKANNELYSVFLTDAAIPQAGIDKIHIYMNSNISESDLPAIVLHPNVKFKVSEKNQIGYWITYSIKESTWIEDKATVDLNFEKNEAFEVGAYLVFLPELTLKNEVITWNLPVLTLDISTNTLSTIANSLAPRFVGDDLTAPHPSLKDYPIKDMLIFQGRLWILTSNSLVASRVNDYFNFYPKTVTSLQADDPIDIEIAEGLEYIIPYQNSLLIVGNKKQFIVTNSSGYFAADTISVTPTTSYALSSSVKPQNLGASILLIGQTGELYEYISKYEVVQTEAIKVSEAYKPQNIENIYVITNKDLVLLKTSEIELAVMTYKNTEDSLYRSFARWVTEINILDIYIANQVYLLGYKNGVYGLFTLDFNMIDVNYFQKEHNIDTFNSYNYYLDALKNITPSVTPSATKYTTTATLDISSLYYDPTVDNTVVLLSYQDDELGLVLTHLYTKEDFESYSNTEINIVLQGHYSDSSKFRAILGYQYNTTIKFQSYMPKDDNGNPLVFKRLAYRKFTLHYIGVDFKISYNNLYELDVTGVVFDKTVWDLLKTTDSIVGLRLSGYKDNKIILDTSSIYPLLVSGIEYQLWYQSKL